MQEGRGGCFVPLTVFFGGFAEAALFGRGEEDGGDEGFLVGGRRLWIWQCVFQFADKSVFGGLVPAKGGAKQHQGLEMGLLCYVVELQVVENAVGVEPLLVFVLGLRCFPAEDFPAEDAEEFLLHILQEVGAERMVEFSTWHIHIKVCAVV